MLSISPPQNRTMIEVTKGTLIISADKNQHTAQSVCWMSLVKEEGLGIELVAPSG